MLLALGVLCKILGVIIGLAVFIGVLEAVFTPNGWPQNKQDGIALVEVISGVFIACMSWKSIDFAAAVTILAIMVTIVRWRKNLRILFPLSRKRGSGMQFTDILFIGAILIAWNFWFDQRLHGLLPRTSWLRSPLKYGLRIVLIVCATYLAVGAGRILGYPRWAQAAFIVLGTLIFVVDVRTEMGQFNPEFPKKTPGK